LSNILRVIRISRIAMISIRPLSAVLQKFASGFSGNYLPSLIQRENGKSLFLAGFIIIDSRKKANRKKENTCRAESKRLKLLIRDDRAHFLSAPQLSSSRSILSFRTCPSSSQLHRNTLPESGQAKVLSQLTIRNHWNIITLERARPWWISVIRESASKVVSLAFSKLHYACVVDDSGDLTGS